MSRIHKFFLAALLLIAAVAPAGAQGPTRQRINFTINVPFELKKTNALLPPGNYVLFQVSTDDPQLFALYQGDLTHEPVAMIRTTRIDYSVSGYPGKTRLLMETDESWPENHPVLEGWKTPGNDGWEMIGAVTRHRNVNSKSEF